MCSTIKDLLNENEVMTSYENLRNHKFQQNLIQQKEENDILKKQLSIKKISTDFSKNKNIVLGIQNDENLIKLLFNIKSKTSVIIMFFIYEGCIRCLIKSKESHPLLFMTFPIDDKNYYSRSKENFVEVYDFPIHHFITKTTVQQNIINGYSLFYTNENRELKLNYITKDDKMILSINTERTQLFVNRCLRPIKPSTETIESFTSKTDEENLQHLFNTQVLVLSWVKNNNIFLQDLTTKTENTMTINISSIEMKITSVSDYGNIYEKTLLTKFNSLIWKSTSLNGDYIIPKQTAILKSNVNSKINNNSYTYVIFGMFRDNYYVLIRLSTLKKINIDVKTNSNNIIHFHDLINNDYVIYQLFFCYKTPTQDLI